MKFRLTPFLIAAVLPILFCIWALIAGYGGNLIGIVVFVCVLVTMLFFALYYISNRIFKQRPFAFQFIVEFFLVLIMAFVYYRQNERILFHMPRNFQGHIVLVYGVPNQPKLKTRHLFSPTIDIQVPPSGMIYTSSTYGRRLEIIDSTQAEVTIKKGGYGIPYFNDTVRCGNERFRVETLLIANLPPGWEPHHDSANRREKLRLACVELSSQ